MEPLRNVNIPYSLSVTGGAIYDFLTLNEDKIKDIDLVLHFPITKRENDEEVKNNEAILSALIALMIIFQKNIMMLFIILLLNMHQV